VPAISAGGTKTLIMPAKPLPVNELFPGQPIFAEIV
jgi:hypothetical protein